MTNQVFIIHTPRKNDQRKRNAFGILRGFGKAYREYYQQREQETISQRVRRETKELFV